MKGMQLAQHTNVADFLIAPDLDRPGLTRRVTGLDQNGQAQDLSVVEERPLTIFLNSREIVTAMTIGDYPEYLALGFLRNQGMLAADEQVTQVDYEEDIDTVVVRTATETSFEDKLQENPHQRLRSRHGFWRYDGGLGGADLARCPGAHIMAV